MCYKCVVYLCTYTVLIHHESSSSASNCVKDYKIQIIVKNLSNLGNIIVPDIKFMHVLNNEVVLEIISTQLWHLGKHVQFTEVSLLTTAKRSVHEYIPWVF